MEPKSPVNPLFSGGGEMGRLMSSLDWSQTAVGPVSQWPESLKTAVRIILNSRFAMFVWWGPERVNLYNDSYVSFLGTKHPRALGRPAQEAWGEIWDSVGPRADAVLFRGESTYDEDLLLLMDRHGYLEETYFTFSYSPLPDDHGNIGGLFCAVSEDTQRVIGERRLKLLREIAAEMADSRTANSVCRSAAQCLNTAQRDLPFSVIYLLEGDGRTLTLAGLSGISTVHPVAPAIINLDAPDNALPFNEVIRSGQPILVQSVSPDLGQLPTGEWTQSPDRLILVPIAEQGQSSPAGVFVAGLNPHRPYDEDFRGFVTLLTNQIAAAIANAVAYETERKRAESLAELDRAKTTFFSNVSHEFRTPLTLLLGPLEEALADQDHRPATDLQRLQVAHRNSLRLLKLVNSLLDFSRIEAGRVQAAFEPVDVAALTADLASGFRSLIEQAGLSFQVSCPPIEAPVYVDQEMWEKIVLNLLSNAFKFTLSGGIKVSQEVENGNLVLRVSDTGEGIPERELPLLFTRFHRVEGTKGRSFEGTGIGLALVQELVKLHKGSISVESRQGHGSTFMVKIPLGAAHLPEDRIIASTGHRATPRLDLFVDEGARWITPVVGGPSGATPEAGDKPTVLVADDNPDMREYIARLLGERYDVRMASDGDEAVRLALECPPELVLTDVMMPVTDGFQVVQKLRAHPSTRTVPIVMLSARSGEESRVEGLQSGADDYLTKPFTAAELLARVETHIRMARMREEAEMRERQLRTEAEVAQKTVSRVLDSITDAFITLDRDWRITYINPEAARLNGKPADAFLGRTQWEEWPGSLGTQVETQYRRAMSQRIPVHFEHHYNDGPSDLFLDIHAYPTEDGLAVYYRDISASKRAAESLQVAHDRLALAQQTASLATWEWNLEDGTLLWADSSSAVYGVPTSELTTVQSAAERILEQDRASTMQELQSSIEQKTEYNHEFRVQWPDGSIHWLVGRGRALYDEQGKPLRVLGINWDITERKRIEAELRLEQARLAEIFQQAPAFIAVLRGPEFVYELTNGPYQRLINNRKVIGKPVIEALPEVEKQGVLQLLQGVYESGKPYIANAFRIDLARSNDELEEHYLDFVYQPVRDSNGKVSAIIVLGVDVTEQRRAQDALLRTEKLAAVGRLAASIAHEINNPLEAVTNLVYLIESSTDQPPVRSYAEMASQELKRVSEITTQTLRFHRQSVRPTWTSVAAIVDSLTTVYQGRFANNGIAIERQSEGQCEIYCLEGEIRQVLSNLIGNAIDALPNGGHLRLRTRDGRRYSDGREGVYITVGDTGSGMPASVKNRVFDAFFTTKQGTGTGLGLWIANGIVHKHQGTIQVHSSQNPAHHGTVFRLFLPFDGISAATETTVPAAAHS